MTDEEFKRIAEFLEKAKTIEIVQVATERKMSGEFEVHAPHPGWFPTPNAKTNADWLFNRLAEVWNNYADEPIDDKLKAKIIFEVGQYFNSSIEDFDIKDGVPVNVIIRHRLNDTKLTL